MNPRDAFVPIQTAEQLFQSAEAALLTPNGSTPTSWLRCSAAC